MEMGTETSSASHLGEGILLANPRSTVTDDDLGKLKYLYKITKLVEVRAPEVHEKVD